MLKEYFSHISKIIRYFLLMCRLLRRTLSESNIGNKESDKKVDYLNSNYSRITQTQCYLINDNVIDSQPSMC